MTLDATVTRFETISCTERELEGMPTQKASEMRLNSFKKVAEEKILDEQSYVCPENIETPDRSGRYGIKRQSGTAVQAFYKKHL